MVRRDRRLMVGPIVTADHKGNNVSVQENAAVQILADMIVSIALWAT